MKTINFTILTIFGLSFVLGSFLFGSSALAGPELIKAVGFDTVYYIDENNVRHPFPNRATYQSWYGDDFSHVVTLNIETLAQYPIGSNITMRPGIKIVKVPSAPQVYAVEQGGMLREILNAEVAVSIYGNTWTNRVVDIPEVFFGDYQLGEPLTRTNTLPDTILMKAQDNGKYYFINHGVLQEFENTQAVLANRYSLDDALSGNRNYYSRSRPITGLAKNVFNPAAKDLSERYDCEAKNLSAAFIFLAEKEYFQNEIDKVETIKTNVPEYFNWVSSELSNINTNFSTVVMVDDGHLLKSRSDGTTEIRNEVINTFYENNEDIFDFIFVFTNFEIPSEVPNRIAYFLPVSNHIDGIGKDTIKASNLYGSRGKLKGVVMMGNVNQYTPEDQVGLDRSLDIVAHELLHQWGAYATFEENGKRSLALLRDDKAHWSNYASFISPLGGSGWTSNGDGTYSNGLASIDSNKRKYSDLDLYLMGLLPKNVIDPITFLIPDEPEAAGNIIKATEKQVTIEQIIDSMRERRCVLE